MGLLNPKDDLPLEQNHLLLLGVPDGPDGKGEVLGSLQAHPAQKQGHNWQQW